MVGDIVLTSCIWCFSPRVLLYTCVNMFASLFKGKSFIGLLPFQKLKFRNV